MLTVNEALLDGVGEPAGATLSAAWRSVLVPIDFTASVRRALQCAVAIAEECQGKITLLYVMGRQRADGSSASVEQSLSADEARFLVEHLIDGMARWEIPRSLEFEKTVEMGGHETEAIVQAARRLASGLIVMGTHEYSWWKHLGKAATAERVVRTAPCPVLSVPETAEAQQ